MDIQYLVNARRKPMKHLCRQLPSFQPLSFLLLYLFSPLQALAFPPDFNAIYQVESHGLVAAQATYKLTHEGQELNFSQHSKAVGFAALFRTDTLIDNSLMSLHDDQLLLKEYSYVQRSHNKDIDIHLAIDWNQSTKDKLHGEISGMSSGAIISSTVNHPVWDTLSFQIPMMMQAPKSPDEQLHAILVKGEIKNYSFISHGEEMIDVAGNTIKTIKIEKNSGNSDRPFYFWMAPELYNLPVKMEKWKNGKPHITMSLYQARFPANDKLRFDADDSSDNFDDI